jgi:hypothetical protein
MRILNSIHNGMSSIQTWCKETKTSIQTTFQRYLRIVKMAAKIAINSFIATYQAKRKPFSLYCIKPSSDQPSLICVFPKDLQKNPIEHLQNLCITIQHNPTKKGKDLEMRFIQGEVTSDKTKALDRLGQVDVSRDYLFTLTTSLIVQEHPLFTGELGVLLPSAKKLAGPALQIFRNLGHLFIYCYLSEIKPKAPVEDFRLTGKHFHPNLFKAIVSLSADEIDQAHLSEDAKEKISTALNQPKSQSFDAIHAIAQGMKERCYPCVTSKATLNSWWNHAIRPICYQELSNKVQGIRTPIQATLRAHFWL